jgi:hypothetical protein
VLDLLRYLQGLVDGHGVAGDIGPVGRAGQIDPDHLAGQTDHRSARAPPREPLAEVVIRPVTRRPLIVVAAPVLLTLPTARVNALPLALVLTEVAAAPTAKSAELPTATGVKPEPP